MIKENGNTRIVIECDCESKNKPEIKWSRNNVEIKNEGRYLIEVCEIKQSMFILVLEIDNIMAADAGTYKVTAKNAKGESVANVELKLDEKKDDVKDKPKPAEKKAEEKPVAKSDDVAPTFKEKPKDQVGIDGDKITVSCKVAGKPNPEVTWYKNKTVIKKSKDFSIELNGEVAKLTINDAYVEDTTSYACELWNEAGQTSADFKVTIKEKKGKSKRTRAAPKPGEVDKKDEDELRKEKRKAEAAEKAKQQTEAKSEPIYEEEGPRRAKKTTSPASGELTPGSTPGSRKTSQPAIKLDVIDETGSKYDEIF